MKELKLSYVIKYSPLSLDSAFIWLLRIFETRASLKKVPDNSYYRTTTSFTKFKIDSYDQNNHVINLILDSQKFLIKKIHLKVDLDLNVESIDNNTVGSMEVTVTQKGLGWPNLFRIVDYCQDLAIALKNNTFAEDLNKYDTHNF